MSDDNIDEKAEALVEKLEALNVVGEATAEPNVKAEGRNGTVKTRGLPYEERVALLEEELKKKKVLETGITGIVRWYSVQGRYGFIERDDGGKDIFVHQTAISKSNTEKYYYRTLATGEKVEFDVVEGVSGPEAASVAGPDGVNVKGFGYRDRRNILHRRNHNKPSEHRHNGNKPAENDEKKSETVEGEEAKSARKTKKRSNRNRKNRKANGDTAQDKPAEVEAKDDANHGTALPSDTSC